MKPTIVPNAIAIAALMKRLRSSRRCSRSDILPSGDLCFFLRRCFEVARPLLSVAVIAVVEEYYEDCSLAPGFVVSPLEITVPSTASESSSADFLAGSPSLPSAFISLTSDLRIRMDWPMLRAIFGSLLAPNSKNANRMRTRIITGFRKMFIVYLPIQLALFYSRITTYRVDSYRALRA